MENRIKEHVLPLEQAELRLDLKQAILQMDRQTQELLLLRYVDGLSPGEAEKCWNCPDLQCIGEKGSIEKTEGLFFSWKMRCKYAKKERDIKNKTGKKRQSSS